MDENNAINLREKCGHFRILVIGRANAGKTTILKKVCNSAKDPKIFSPSGKKLRLATVKGSAERGEHNIDNELIFKSNPKFIFHDSRGFESGSVNETETVKAFIERRAASETLSEQIHVIWYCLPTDTPRPLLEADEQFFNYSGSGKVPVIAIFTKFDGLVTTALQKLRNEGKTRREAMADATEVAQGMLTADFVDQLNKMSFPPSDYVQVDDLRNEASTCIELINKTANSLNDDTLRLLFVSVQQNNIDLCILYAMKQMLESNSSSVRASLNYTLMYFPHVWSHEEYDTRQYRGRYYRQASYNETIESNITSCINTLQEKIPDLAESIKVPVGRAILAAMLCICAEQTFTEASASAEHFGPAASRALAAYVGSPTEVKVIKEIREGVNFTEFDNQPEDAGEAKIKDQAERLTDIVKRHRLRIRSTQTMSISPLRFLGSLRTRE